MTDEEEKKPQIPSKMSRIAWPKAKFGLYLGLIIVFLILFVLYKDLIFEII